MYRGASVEGASRQVNHSMSKYCSSNLSRGRDLGATVLERCNALRSGRWTMPPTNAAITPQLAARLGWEVARRDDARSARRLAGQQRGDGGYRWDEGAVLDGGCHGRDQVGALAWLTGGRGATTGHAPGGCVCRARRPEALVGP
jgi:hypothetical protein